MAKFSATQSVHTTTPVQTVSPTPDTLNHGGVPAHTRNTLSDLFLLGVTNMVGEDTFYETAKARDSRFAQLVHAATIEDPAWVAEYATWLRTSANMRSAPIVVLAEYARTHQTRPELLTAAPPVRTVVARTLTRADEPGELLAYWHSKYGRKLPKGLKRGIADAAVKLYNEYSALKYDRPGLAWRFGDVIDLTHPTPKDARQSALFKRLLDERHNRADVIDPENLPVLSARWYADRMPVEARRRVLTNMANLGTVKDFLDERGATWEWVSGWLADGIGMDAAAWEAVIPSMGYMALLRNLRNFDQAGISAPAAGYVAAVLSDPDEVARSRQFPYRFFSAYKAVKDLSVRWLPAIEQGLIHSTQNLPDFSGETLIIVDTSGSMGQQVSAKSTIRHSDIAGVFAGALASRVGTDRVRLVAFATYAQEVGFPKGASPLAVIRHLDEINGRVGYSTNLQSAIDMHEGENRIVVFSDMQVTGYVQSLPKAVRHTWLFNTGGYASVPYRVGRNGIHEIGGFSDAAFRMVPTVESGRDGAWPWEAAGQ